MTDIEQITLRLIQEIGRQARAKVVNAEKNGYPETAVYPYCEREMLYVRRRSAQLRTLFGCLQVKRADYLYLECHQGCCPLDRRLRFRPCAIIAELERLGEMTGALFPYGKGRSLNEWAN